MKSKNEEGLDERRIRRVSDGINMEKVGVTTGMGYGGATSGSGDLRPQCPYQYGSQRLKMKNRALSQSLYKQTNTKTETAHETTLPILTRSPICARKAYLVFPTLASHMRGNKKVARKRLLSLSLSQNRSLRN